MYDEWESSVRRTRNAVTGFAARYGRYMTAYNPIAIGVSQPR
jgi:hypothetical protein